MIKMKAPSLVINSCDVPFPKYRMWETINASSGMNVTMMVNEIVRVNRLALENEESQLLNVIINCHGWEGGGGLCIGGTDDDDADLDIKNVGYFSLLRKRNIGTIWLVACQAATGEKGKQLCRALAYFSGCQVVAADVDQVVGAWGTWRVVTSLNQIDKFEGKVYSFTAMGGMRVIDPHSEIYTILD